MTEPEGTVDAVQTSSSQMTQNLTSFVGGQNISIIYLFIHL